MWQVAQVPGNTLACEKFASQVVVRWHASQLCVFGTWPDGLPFAVVPLWQVAHVPGATPVWLNVAGVQAGVRWHAAQL